MKIKDIIDSGTPLQLVVSAIDLKELFLNWQDELSKKENIIESSLLTSAEVAVKYHISKVTLWRWAKEGLLKPVKMGRKSFYRQVDIERVFGLNN